MAKRQPRVSKTAAVETSLIGDFTCPNCEHTEFKELHELPTTAYQNETEDGQKYTHIVRHQVECAQCGQRSMLLRKSFDPAAWKD